MKFELNEYHGQLTDEEIIQDIIETAQRLCTDYMSIATYKKEGKYSQTAVQGHFGTWKNALEIAGLQNTGFCKDKITEQQCFDEI